ncbi:ABC transporter substrate-binding protein [Desulfococcus sp.]|uniref:ABC transporter substrate-binding protein n=1 Tax=Desulfococcus sp. TaxID=2025834 RepID=UPI0035945F48
MRTSGGGSPPDRPFPAPAPWPKRLDALTAIGMIFLGVILGFPKDGRGAPEDQPLRAVVLISQNIRPYIEAADRAAETLQGGGLQVETIQVETLPADEKQLLEQAIDRNAYDLLLTVGPEASRFAWSRSRTGACPVIYTMVLNPERLPDAPADPCGISLGIPIEVQMQSITRILPSVKRIGLMFDPGNNAWFHETAERIAAAKGLSVTPIRLSSRKEISRALEAVWGKIDGLWLVPDRTIISESIVQYLIKQALLNDTPVVGYNRFFYESGAAISFVFDYGKLGEQAGRLAIERVQGRECGHPAPAFKTWINTRVLEKLEIPLGDGGGSVILK